MSEMSFVIFRGRAYRIKKNILVLRNKGINSIDEIEGLQNMPYLASLDLSNNNIREIKSLGSLQGLVTLNLSGNTITEIKGLENLTNINSLDLSRNGITEIKGLDTLKRLRFLNLSFNNITEIKGLNNLTELMVLNLERNSIKEITGLENVRKLNALYLANNFITEVRGIQHLRNLKRFDLGRVSRVPRDQMKRVQRAGIITKEQRYFEKRAAWQIFGYFIAVIITDLILSASLVAGFKLGVDALLPAFGLWFFPCMILVPFLYCFGKAYSGY
ncbi:MAG: leucine-rich repeat domain-containing protein [Promethearchaeota archaeon]